MDGRGQWGWLGVVCFLGACAHTATSGGTGPGARGDECLVEARNETGVSLSVSHRAGQVQIGELPPGGRARFGVSCEDGPVTVVGSALAETRAPSPTAGAPGATCTVTARVRPQSGQVVVARLIPAGGAPLSRTPSGCRPR